MGYVGTKPAAGPLDASQIPDHLLELDKLITQQAMYLLGRATDGTGDAEPIYIGRGLSLSGKNLLADVAAVQARVPKRNCILSAKTTGGVNSAMSTTGSATVALQATATPMILAFAAGFGTDGQRDVVAAQSSDVTLAGGTPAAESPYYGVSFPTDQTSYIFADCRGNSSSTPESLLHFEGADGTAVFTDEYGNAWTNTGVEIDTSQFKFGQSSALFDGADYLTLSGITQLSAPRAGETGNGVELSFWVRPSSLPTAGNRQTLFGAYNAGGYGLEVNLYNQAGTVKLELNASTDGVSNDWASASLGTVTAVAAGTWYRIRVELRHSGAIKVYCSTAGAAEGTDISVSVSGKYLCALTRVRLGANGSGNNGYQGWMDEFRLFPYVVNAAATTPPAVRYEKTDPALYWGATILPPQIGEAYDRTKNALLHFEGTSTTDEYGNTWNQINAPSVAALPVAPKVGSKCLQLTAASSQYVDLDLLSPQALFTDGWTIAGWVNFTTKPSTPNDMVIACATNAAGYGVSLALNNTTGTYKLRLSVSSNGTSNDVVAAVLETSGRTVNTGQWYHFAVTYDPLAGKYFVYWDGVVVAGLTTTSTSKVCAVDSLRIGASRTPGSYLDGAIDEFRMSPCVRYPNGTTFTPSTSAFTVEGDYFNVVDMKHYQVIAPAPAAGSDPVMREVARVYIGEADNVGAVVTAVRNYALRGRYVSADSAITASTATSYTTNLGVPPKYVEARAFLKCITQEGVYAPGDVTPLGMRTGAGVDGAECGFATGRNAGKIVVGGGIVGISGTAGADLTAAKWNKFLVAERKF